MFIIKHKNVFIGISAFLVLLSLASIFVYGVKPGIDFTGGSLLEVEYGKAAAPVITAISASDGEESVPVISSTTPAVGTAKSGRPDVSRVKDALKIAGFSDALVQPTGDAGYLIRTKTLTDKEHTEILSALSLNGSVSASEKRFTSIGPLMGAELQAKAWVATAAVILAIMAFIAFAFRKVSVPVSSSKYGLMAVVALVHDVVIPSGVLAFLGHYYAFEADILFVTALLIILGFSVHDTIVVFDRVRENLKLKISEDFSTVVGKSLEQTFVRSLNTSMTVILVLVMLVVFGPSSTFNFSVILLVGITMGTYSSIFLASPLLVVAEEWKRNRIPVVVAAPVENKPHGKKKKKNR